jgi:hypothetical protein
VAPQDARGGGDFNSDGKSDILWQGSDGTPAIWFMDGTHFVSGSVAGSGSPGPERIHKEVLDFKHIEAISEPMRELIEDLWPELLPKLPPKTN